MNLLDLVGRFEAVRRKPLGPWLQRRNPVRRPNVKALINGESSRYGRNAQAHAGS